MLIVAILGDKDYGKTTSIKDKPYSGSVFGHPTLAEAREAAEKLYGNPNEGVRVVQLVGIEGAAADVLADLSRLFEFDDEGTIPYALGQLAAEAYHLGRIAALRSVLPRLLNETRANRWWY